jgi:hypothetical protein
MVKERARKEQASKKEKKRETRQEEQEKQKAKKAIFTSGVGLLFARTQRLASKNSE